MKGRNFLVVSILFFVICNILLIPVCEASNPFTDVPSAHWAYDALSLLAARGLLSGYPDGAFKGASSVTRYEMASAVARVLAEIDVEKVDKRDIDLIKELVAEFSDELGTLNVKVEKIDARLDVMEKDIGGWSMSGVFQFDAKFGADVQKRFDEQPW